MPARLSLRIELFPSVPGRQMPGDAGVRNAILSGCMGAVYFLRSSGEESTVARCLKVVMPRASRLWIFHWADAAYTCYQILEHLPKKQDEGASHPRRSRALGEALYSAWKLGTAGVMPALLMGKSPVAAGKDSVLLVKDRLPDLALLRAGYSSICWGGGILAYASSAHFFWEAEFFARPGGLWEGGRFTCSTNWLDSLSWWPSGSSSFSSGHCLSFHCAVSMPNRWRREGKPSSLVTRPVAGSQRSSLS